MFTTDRDLLALEPTLFRDIAWIGQRLFTGYVTITGSTLTIETAELNFEQTSIAAGHIIVVDGAPYEVVERLSPTTLSISRLRPSTADPIQLPSPVANKLAAIHTFAPQIALVHQQLLAMLGLAPAGGEGLTETAIANPQDLAPIEALGTLHLIFSLATAPLDGRQGDDRRGKALLYQQRYSAERQLAAAYIDTDGDGLPNALRRFSFMHLSR